MGAAQRCLWLAATIASWVTFIACGGGDSTPLNPASTPTTAELSGTVTATNGGQALRSASIEVAGRRTVTDAAGHFVVSLPSAGPYTLTISGNGLLPHVLTVNAGTVSLDAITRSNGFDLDFYREFVRGALDQGGLSSIRRWTRPPTFTIHPTDDRGSPIAASVLTMVQANIEAAVPAFSGGVYTAVFLEEGDVTVVIQADPASDGACGRSSVGPVPGQEVVLHLNCLTPGVVRHEIGHVMGFFHTNGPTDLMRNPVRAVQPSARESYHAAIAYSRQAGNVDPDDDLGYAPH